MTSNADYECPGGEVDGVYVGLATGLCPECGEFVPLLSDGHTVRHDRTVQGYEQFGRPAQFRGSDCICGEINARHCPVHNDGSDG